MKQLNRCIAVLLCAVLLLTGYLSIGTSQARFVNAVSWHGVYVPEMVTVISDKLCEGGQTVVLADWYLDDETGRDYAISLKTEAGTAQGNMACQTPDGDLIRVSVDADGVVVDEGETVVMLSVELKKAALSLKRETTVSVVVSWTDVDRGTVLWADFNCTLIPAEQEETEPETEKPTEKETEPPTEEVTEAPTEKETEASTEKATEAPTEKETEASTEKATEAPTEKETEASTEKVTEAPTNAPTESQTTESGSEEQGSETEQTASETAEGTPAVLAAEEQEELSVAAETEAPGEPVETEEPTQTPTETEAPAQGSSETEEVTQKPSESEGATQTPSENEETTQVPSETGKPTEAPAETEKPTEAPEETSEPTQPPKKPTGPDIPVEIVQHTEHIAWSEWFGLQIAVPDGVSYLEVYYNGSDFPKGTRFILNESLEILPEIAQTFIIPVSGQSTQLLLINMADVREKDRQEVMEIMVTANGADGTEFSLDSVQVNVTRTPLEFPEETDYTVLSSTASMNISCTWDASDVICKVERLVRNEDGGISWQEGEYDLTVQIPQDYDPEKEQTFTVSNENGNAPAGCYRITVRREFEGMVISEKQILFFIHY